MINGQSEKVNRKAVRALIYAALLLMLAAVISLPVFAWFYYGRNAAGIKKISDPTAIFINAGNQEDIRYLNLAGIDVEGTDHDYEDFVFCVRGNAVNQYKLQLAYTTNNQFEYEVYYPVSETTDGNAVPGNALARVEYVTHPAAGSGDPEESQYYYVANGASPLAFNYLNKDTTAEPEILAKTGSDSYYELTYKPEGAAAVYNKHHKYAVPIYKQTVGTITVADEDNDENGNFCHYFVLRVIWTSAHTNNKETDIIYITAKNVGG